MAKYSAQDVEKMIEEQKNFFLTGYTKNLEFRKKQLLKLKNKIKQYEKEILKALNLDLGKSEFEAYSNEIGIVLDSINHFIKNIDEWSKPVHVKTPIHFQPAKSFIIREPYGVVLIIGPFNYPFQLVMEPLIGAIIGGNTAIVKPSETTAHTTEIIKKILEETFDTSYIRVVEGEKEEVTHLIHASFDYIFFTGSVAVGKVIMRAAAERLTPITLELGGKSPAIVDQTANLDVAAKRIVWGKFNNTGQTCVAPDYLLVHSSIYDEFIKKLQNTIVQFYGEDAQFSDDYGRIVSNRHFTRLQKLLEAENANITFGGKLDAEKLYIEPTILENVDWSSPIMEDEIFGPILPIMKYDNLKYTILQIQKLPKPLAAYFFSEHEKAIDYFLEELPFGGGCINDTVTHVANPYLPFGGVGPSGVNAYHGKASFENFTHPKSIMKRSSKMANNLLFPPYKQKLKLVRTMLK
ncbi:aldehyde dehydrogenase [Ureibacillus sinduriensis]|uniref:Aldehyde dehydrogenase n=1 Tax=Ureibacillus sinduriensis BLB-1 = JCM 15800 TaxID=1384057 RepID=A0A0A3HTT7_9BACL|nr:aldehyde dehydrogenase [Ureibacillus sinduriensis]KGR73708.1 aldehyde dehydrogenase [Ureibacillus sinduriensis BLB-1 = JCM 15800]